MGKTEHYNESLVIWPLVLCLPATYFVRESYLGLRLFIYKLCGFELEPEVPEFTVSRTLLAGGWIVAETHLRMRLRSITCHFCFALRGLLLMPPIPTASQTQ